VVIFEIDLKYGFCYNIFIKPFYMDGKYKMSAINLTHNLPAKFTQHILSSTNQPQVFQAVQRAFAEKSLKPLSSDKPYILQPEGLNYLIKGQRSDGVGSALTQLLNGLGRADDVHIYRVRKAAKIQRLIERYGLQEHVEVPMKWLYWNADDQKWYVVSEKVELSDELPMLNSDYSNSVNQEKPQVESKLPADLKKVLYDETCSRKAMTPGQVRALAIFAMEAAYTDTNLSNVNFTKNGKIAIIDTEPVKRPFFKLIKSNPLFKCGLFDFYPVKLQGLFLSTSMIRLSHMSPEAESALRNVENYYIAKCAVRKTVRIAALIFAWGYAKMIPLMFAPFVAKVVVAMLLLQTAALILSCVIAMHQSRNKGVDGFMKLRQMEQGAAL